MKLIKGVLLTSLIAVSLSTYATTSKTDLENSIQSVQLTEISPIYIDLENTFSSFDKGATDNPQKGEQSTDTPPAAQGGFSVNGASLNTANQSLGTIVEITDKLIAIGQKIWKIVDAGRPVSNIDGIAPSISVLPRGLADSGSLYDMYGWSEPMVKSYNLDYKNGVGSTVITLRFSVITQYGGTDGNGGVYLSGVSIVPNQVRVAWGWDFNAQTRLINITNRGTALNPVAAATLELGYQVKNFKTDENKRIRFFVEATGKITQIN